MKRIGEIKERKHRLPRELYRGRLSAAFTLCINNGTPAFTEPQIVNTFTDTLAAIVARERCIVPVYCFMPDHQHILISGISDESDLWKAIVGYKQKTGFWMSGQRPDITWQKDFYDHIIRSRENLAVQVRYVLDNPVRKGLVTSWLDHPFKGSLGCELEAVLNGII